MPNLLQQLENNEAVLLMYLADELPTEDRAEVAQLLATDASLRAELEDLRAAWDHSMGAVDRMNQKGSSSLNEPGAIRSVLRHMRRKMLENQARPVAEVDAPTASVPRWLVTSVAAAVLLVSYVAWWGLRSESPPDEGRGSFVETATEEVLPEPSLEGLAIEQTADELRDNWLGADETMDVLTHPLSEAEMLLALLGETSQQPGADFASDLLDKPETW